MRKITIVAATLLFGCLSLAIGSDVSGISETIVISGVQVRDAMSSTNESVTLTNNTTGDVDITGWCLQYASSSMSVASQEQVVWRNLACFQSTDEVTYIMLPPHQSALAVSAESGWSGDLTFSATLANVSGHIRVVDANNQEIDKIGWGEARYPEMAVVPTPPVGEMLQRITDGTTGSFVDTDDNLDDFISVPEQVPSPRGAIYSASDICINLEGLQLEVPDGYVGGDGGQCFANVDICPNIDDVQYVIPEGYEVDESGNCVQDLCLNLLGMQPQIPDGYQQSDEGSCLLGLLPLELSEALPNPKGSDIGKEFIELYNPNQQTVWLQNYVLYIGKNYETAVTFSDDNVIKANEYLVVDNSIYPFTLLNTTTHVLLASIDGKAIDELPAYQNPRDDMAWAKVDNVWQYTNRPTPGANNLASLVLAPTPVASANTAALKPCATNQYRNPATNRCKLITVSASQPQACKSGQFRNPETGRCKAITSATSVLADCGEGKERNPETNRCRNVQSDTVPSADYAVLGEQDDGSSVSYLVITILAVAALGGAYAIWEWRQSIGHFFKKVWLVVRFRK